MRSLVASRLITISVSITLATALLTLALIRHTPNVAAQGSSACIAAPSGLVNWWPGDGHAFDIQDGNHGTLQNSASFAPGKAGQAFSFIASQNSAVKIPHATSLNPTRITIEAWVKPTSFPTLASAIVRKEGQYNLMVGNGINASGVPHCDMYITGGKLWGATPVPLNEWTHLACTYDGSTVRLYQNGAQINETSVTGSVPSGTRDLYIGRLEGNTTRSFNGLIDEVGIYNRALSATEVQAIVSGDSSVRCKPFIAVVDTKGTYLHTNSDNPAPPAIVDLAAGGFAPGDVIKLSYAVTPPGFYYICGSSYQTAEQLSFLGVFSGSNTLLAPSAHPRVPNAIDAGTDFISNPTHYGGQPTDIPQDFRITPPSGLTIQIPAGATHLFLAVHDSLYSDNCGTIKVTIERVNQPPAAMCQNVTVSAGANCTASASIDNGSSDPDGDTISIAQSPAGPYPLGNTLVTLTLTDSKGASSTCAATVTVVDSTPPQVTPPPDASYQCLSQVPAGDPAQAIATDSCSSPVAITVADASNGGAGSPSSPLVITRIFTAKDAAGNSNSAAQTITVIDDTLPTIIVPSAVSVSTGAGATACGAAVSDAALGTATASDNCGSVTITRSGVPAGNFFPAGTTTITYTATDAAGNTTTATQTVIVIDNTAPVIACPASLTVAGNILDSCAASVSVGTSTATDNCGAPTVTGTRSDSLALNMPYPLGTTTITWKATDAVGNQSTCQQTVTVINPAPVATITAPTTGAIYAVNTPVSFTGSFSDNAGGTHTATWTFDNLTSTGTVNEATGAITGSYSFTAAGVYKVTLTVADGCGGSHTADQVEGLTALIVIYDPSGGWVTGGGWINSPAGAYVASPSLTGKANFGFVSKYQNGASVPTGNTEFQFKAGNLNFSSTVYEWLVIAGARAQYKGAGTINGAGDYRFMLTVIDGDQPGGGQDKFRIRIWNNNGGGLVYDNQFNAPDSEDPTTVLGGGNIVIHK